jgi:hypothetical protein
MKDLENWIYILAFGEYPELHTKSILKVDDIVKISGYWIVTEKISDFEYHVRYCPLSKRISMFFKKLFI